VLPSPMAAPMVLLPPGQDPQKNRMKEIPVRTPAHGRLCPSPLLMPMAWRGCVSLFARAHLEGVKGAPSWA